MDFITERKIRQQNNNKAVLETILETPCESGFFRNKNLKCLINTKELLRVLEELELSECEVIEKCHNDVVFCKLLSGRISKKASRQGILDEKKQLLVYKNELESLSIKVERLTIHYRPMKNTSQILSDKQRIETKIPLTDCLKSFDGKLSGKLTAWIFCKVVMGSGGHQDNVFEEARLLARWVYKKTPSDLIIIIIDTNDKNYKKIREIKEKYNSEKLLITNSINFLIDVKEILIRNPVRDDQ